MKNPLPLLALALLAVPAFAQSDWGKDPGNATPKKFERKATKLASKDSDYDKLTDDEKELLIKAVAAKMAKIDKENRKGGKYKDKVTGVNIRVILANTDLDEVKKKHPELVLKEKRGEVIREKEWGNPGTPDKTIEEPPSLKVETIPSPDFHSLFPDNDWVLDENSCDAGMLQSMVDDAVEKAGKDGKIQHIAIDASASKYRNTGKAEKYSFKELSQKRAEAARDYVIKKLAEKGKVVSPADVAIDVEGDNGDGTSGPEPGKEPKESYDKYKYVHVEMYVAKVTEEQKPPTVIKGTPADEHAEVVTFGVDTDSRCKFLRCITLPSFKIARRVSKKNWGSTKCPKF